MAKSDILDNSLDVLENQEYHIKVMLMFLLKTKKSQYHQ